MDKGQLEYYESIRTLKVKLSEMQTEYWQLYSSMETWQFWVLCILFFITPLLVLYFFIDRSKVFLLGFYGFNVHVWFAYIDTWGTKNGMWGYPFEFIPFLPDNISIDAALVPISYMLVYQWTLNHKKNYYLYTLALSLFFAFIFKPFIASFHFIALHKGTTFFHLFLGYCVIFLLSKIITNIFSKMEDRKRVA